MISLETKMRLKNLLFTAFALVFLVNSSLALPAPAQEDDGGLDSGGQAAPKKLLATANVTWWFHSALGYHPAVLMRIENASGQRIDGAVIKFQARFTNLRDGYVNVARDEVRTNLEPGRQIIKFLYAPRAFELPIDQNAWPKMECKVMCKIGDDDDAPTQTLIITKLNSMTMSYDDATNTLTKLPDIRVGRQRSTFPSTEPHRVEKPLIAMAGSLNGKSDKPKVTMTQFLSSSSIPGLGDDFYSFEKKYGMPAEYDSGKEGMYARYQSQSPEMSLIVSSRGQTGKADLIVATVPPSQIKGEGQVTELAKAISGKFRSEAITAPTHSVRYLPNARLEFGSLNAKNYRCMYFVPGEAPGSHSNAFIVVVTRLPGNILNVLRSEVPRSKLLKFLTPMIGIE